MSTCTLCDLPAEGVTAEGVEGTFCCRGCLEVYRTLGDVDLESAGGVASEESPWASAGDPDLRAGEVDEGRAEATETAYLAVDGMHCSACEVYLEMRAGGLDGVARADASYAAEALRVEYDPDRLDEGTIADAASGLGYRARGRGRAQDTAPQSAEQPAADAAGDESGSESVSATATRTDTDAEGATATRTDPDAGTTGGTDLASRLLVGGLFGMMAMTWYALFLYPTYFGFDPIVTLGQFDGFYLYGQLAVVTAIVLLYTGRPMLRGAYVSLRTGRPNVDLLVTTAAAAAYLYSTGQLLLGGTTLYYDVTIVVVLAVTVGNYYETRIKRRTAGLLADLTEVQVSTATRRDGTEIAVDEVEPGAELVVRPGERVPVDGTVVEGTAAVDEALVTGESMPVQKEAGDAVRGGTVVTDAPLVVEAGEATENTLDRVVDLLWEIQASRPGAQRVADRLATVFVPLVLVLAVVTGGAFLLLGSGIEGATLAALTVLIVSCPCALGLATPLAVASGLQSAAQRGVVVTTPALFEHGGEVDTVVFDKTGTLTAGEMAVTDVHADGASEDALLSRAGALEQFVDHPVAGAVVDAARVGEARTDGGTARETPTESSRAAKSDVASVETHSRGVTGTVDGESVAVGHPDLLRAQGYEVGEGLAANTDEIRGRGDSPVLVGWDGRARGVVAVGDTERADWERVVATLGEGRRTVVLTGDDGPAAASFREADAVDEVFAGVPPAGKAETVRRLGATGTVAMVGDGSNDAPALAAADVGIAMESGTKLATDAADAVVLGGDLARTPAVFAVAAATRRRIRENLAWAFVYNGVAIPLAITGVLNPLFAALAMAGSSLLVVANSARDPTPADGPPRDGDGHVAVTDSVRDGGHDRERPQATPEANS